MGIETLTKSSSTRRRTVAVTATSPMPIFTRRAEDSGAVPGLVKRLLIYVVARGEQIFGAVVYCIGRITQAHIPTGQSCVKRPAAMPLAAGFFVSGVR